ncbi:MAG: hypothetical protein LCH61_19290 [Proteobacteria bacterium]|nr:hypothetical protein [Pseudomonadota bacterium]
MATEAYFKLARLDQERSREDIDPLVDHYANEVKAGLARTGTAAKRDGAPDSLRDDAGYFRSMTGSILVADNQNQHVIDPEALTELDNRVR